MDQTKIVKMLRLVRRLKTTIRSLEGTGRFVVGLATDIKIVEDIKLR